MDTTLLDKAVKIPISGTIFTAVNVCTSSGIDKIVLNFQTNGNPIDDVQYYLSVSEAMSLMNELHGAIVRKGIK